MHLLTIKEVAEILRVRDQRAYQLIHAKILPAVRIGRQLRVSEDSLREFVESGGQALPGGWRHEKGSRELAAHESPAG